jgi:hypothetical protein
MLVGHFAVALAAKKAEPRLSLGTYVLAAMLADLVLVVLWMGSIEQVEITSGVGAAEYYHAIDIGWSHSLVTGVAAGALAALLTLALQQGNRAATLVGIAVISHWVLDAASHPPDMPLVPHGQTLVGLGLWTSLPLTLLVEGSLWLVTLGIYSVSFPARSKAGLHGFWGVTALLTLVWYNNVAGAAPPDPKSAPAASLVLFLLVVAWAYWIDGRRRPPVTN